MCWTWGPYMWGWWWIFPVIGFMFMMIMIFACSGIFRKRGSFCSMGRYDHMEDLKREIGELKEQITQLKRTGG
jgi:uncharacterized membrane protein